MIKFAIVGLGSWGLSVLERSVSRARQTGIPIQIHVIQPGDPGGGAYNVDQPDYLVLNNACGQLSLHASPDGGDRPYAVGLYEWAAKRGYRWVGSECRIGSQGRPIAPTDYLPRRLMGEYLIWFYDELIRDVPPNLEIIRHFAAAVDIIHDAAGGERIYLDDGSEVRVRQVVITSGHTPNDEPPPSPGKVNFLSPYPVDVLDDALAAGTPVAIAGMGLVELRSADRAAPWGAAEPTSMSATASDTSGAAGSHISTCTPAPACRTAPNRPTAWTLMETTTPSCARPRSSRR